jgi:hypothetical protein
MGAFNSATGLKKAQFSSSETNMPQQILSFGRPSTRVFSYRFSSGGRHNPQANRNKAVASSMLRDAQLRSTGRAGDESER